MAMFHHFEQFLKVRKLDLWEGRSEGLTFQKERNDRRRGVAEYDLGGKEPALGRRLW